jgi:signal transduction histidine kinase
MLTRIDELEHQNAALEAFAGIAAHELMEPLVITQAFASMVAERLDGHEHADSREDLAMLGRAASRTRLLLEALLHDARVGEHGVTRLPVDLNVLVGECAAMLAPEIRARDARLQVSDLPVVSGDETLLSGLFVNLMMNALKYSRREGAQIAVDAALEVPAWNVSVTSEGPTIPAADRHRIFEPYQRGRGERRTRGAGLGLAICRRIVERHGGRIGVVPATGGGNRFFFTLPT